MGKETQLLIQIVLATYSIGESGSTFYIDSYR